MEVTQNKNLHSYFILYGSKSDILSMYLLLCYKLVFIIFLNYAFLFSYGIQMILLKCNLATLFSCCPKPTVLAASGSTSPSLSVTSLDTKSKCINMRKHTHTWRTQQDFLTSFNFVSNEFLISTFFIMTFSLSFTLRILFFAVKSQV